MEVRTLTSHSFLIFLYCIYLDYILSSNIHSMFWDKFDSNTNTNKSYEFWTSFKQLIYICDDPKTYTTRHVNTSIYIYIFFLCSFIYLTQMNIHKIPTQSQKSWTFDFLFPLLPYPWQVFTSPNHQISMVFALYHLVSLVL